MTEVETICRSLNWKDRGTGLGKWCTRNIAGTRESTDTLGTAERVANFRVFVAKSVISGSTTAYYELATYERLPSTAANSCVAATAGDHQHDAWCEALGTGYAANTNIPAQVGQMQVDNCAGTEATSWETQNDGYRGCQTKTRSGAACVRWKDLSFTGFAAEQDASYGTAGTALTEAGTHNYCRNPRTAGGTRQTIYCYTDAADANAWEYCDPRPVPTSLGGWDYATCVGIEGKGYNQFVTAAVRYSNSIPKICKWNGHSFHEDSFDVAPGLAITPSPGTNSLKSSTTDTDYFLAAGYDKTFNSCMDICMKYAGDECISIKFKTTDDSNFIETVGKAITGHNDREIENISKAECKARCIAETTFYCKSIDY